MIKRAAIALVLALVLLAGGSSGPATDGGALARTSDPTRFLISLTGAPGARDVAAANAARVHEAEPLLRFLRETGAIGEYVTNAGDGTAVVEGTSASLRALRRFFGAEVAPLTRATGRAHAARLQAMAAASGMTAGSEAIVANFSMGSSYVSGQGPINTVIQGTLLDANGAVIARSRDKSDSAGYYSMYFEGYVYNSVLPGYRVRLKAGSAVLNLKVPALNLAGNRKTDVVKGRAPKNGPVIVTATHYTYNASGSNSVQYPLAVIANGQGVFSVDYTAFVNLVGNDSLSVKYVYPGSSNYVTFSTNMPYIYGYLDFTDIGGSGTPGPGTVTVKNRGGRQIFKMPIKVNWDGDWDDDLTNGLVAVALRPLMTVTMASEQDVRLKLPRLTARLKRTAKTVSGRGPANMPYAMYEANPYKTYYGQIAANGQFSQNISAGGALTADTAGVVILYLPSGDLVYRTW